MKDSRLRLLFVAQALAAAYFWIAIAVPYLLYRGLSPTQAFSLMAIYQLMGVFLEYPTGVIGDKFGYRKVTYLSNVLNFLSMIIMSLQGGYYLYLFALLLLSIGNSFSSGNDMGMIKIISKNLKRDTANYNAMIEFMLFLSALVGGIISQKMGYEFALILSGVCMLLANLPLFLLGGSMTQDKNTDSFRQIVTDGLTSLRDRTLRQIFILVACFSGLAFSIKSIFGGFADIYQIDVTSIGILVGLSGLSRSIGGKLYAQWQVKQVALMLLLVALLTFTMTVWPIYQVIVVAMLFSQLLSGFVFSKIDGDIHDLAHDHVRASLFSLKRLTNRLTASAYIALYGYLVGAGQFSLMMLITGAMMILGIILAKEYLVVKLEK